MIASRSTHADALHASGKRDEAASLFADAEQRQEKWQPAYPLLYSLQGYRLLRPAAGQERPRRRPRPGEPDNRMGYAGKLSLSTLAFDS